MDACQLEFADNTFDTVVTVCTFCSVPKPLVGPRELYRVLKPGGQILMFEHVRSRIGPLGVFLDLMTPLSRRLGADLNRDNWGTYKEPGFASAAKKTFTRYRKGHRGRQRSCLTTHHRVSRYSAHLKLDATIRMVILLRAAPR